MATLFRYELRMTLRDTRTVILSVLLPLLVMPLVFYASSRVEKNRAQRLEATEYTYAIGGEEADWVREVVEAALDLPAEAEGEEPGQQSAQPFYRFREVSSDDPREDIRQKRLHLLAEGESEEQVLERWDEQEEGDDSRTPARMVTLVFRADKDASREGQRQLKSRLLSLREQRRDALLSGVASEELFPVEEQSLATAGQESGAQVGRFLVLFLVMLVMSGGSVVAIDSIAGEKERGSLETLLTTACTREEIVASKLLLILGVALFITLSQVANLAIYVGLELFELPAGFLGAVTPAVALTLMALLVPVALMASGVLLLISGRAKSYKQAQLFFFPVYLASMLPALAAVLPGIRLRSAIVLVPLANVSVAVREVLAGTFDLPMLLLTFLVTTGAAVLAAWFAVRTLKTEHLVLAGVALPPAAVGGRGLFARHVLGWYLLAWVVILIVPMNISALANLEGQVLFNVVLVFLGGSLLLIRRYRLNMREAFALRAPHPLAWLGVLIGAPSAFVLGGGVFQLSNKLFPAPQAMLENLSQLILPEELSLWKLLFFVALLPGVCEELAFRGVLLHGLRGRMKTLPAILVSAAVFGVFHVTLFRLIPTAYLGLVFGCVVVLTGSIYITMAWHALNNAFPILLIHFGWMPESFSTVDYVLAGVGLAAAFALFFTGRRIEQASQE